MRNIQLKDSITDVLDVSPKQRTVKAVWSRMNNVDLDNDIIVPEAFTKTLKERGPMGKNMIFSLVDHKADMHHVIGKPSEIYVDGDKLVAVTKIVPTSMGEDIIKLYDAGLINQHSIGFSTIKQTEEVNGPRVIKELKLYEGSAVLWGANPETPTIAMKSNNIELLSLRLESLKKAFKNGTFTNETFAFIETEIKRIEQGLESTQSATAIKSPNEDEQVLKAINQFNNLFKK